MDLSLSFDMDPYNLDMPVRAAGNPTHSGRNSTREDSSARTRDYVMADGVMLDISCKCEPGLSSPVRS